MGTNLTVRRTLELGLLVCILLPGCGPKQVAVNGKVMINGQPYKPKTADELQIILRPTGKGLMCAAAVRLDGTFKIQGPTGGGVPPGTYRVEIAAYSDNFKGEFTGERSPLSFEAKTSPAVQTIVIDVGTKKVTTE